ncbi:MAG: flippase [Prevotella sp.]|nr:flippase [Candidatus Equicola faecalis]
MSPLTSFSKKFGLSHTKEVIARNLFWAICGKLASLVSGLIVGILIARYLGPERYGLMNYIISFVFIFQTFALFGLDNIEVREESKLHISYETIIGTAFCIKFIFGVAFIILSIIVSCIMESDKEVIALVALYSISIVLNSFNVIKNYFISKVQNEYVVKVEIATILVSLVLKIMFLLTKASLVWFILSATLDFMFTAIGYSIAYKSKIGPIKKWRFNYRYAIFLIKESFPLMLTSAAVIVYQRIDQVMIGQMIDKEAVGYFSVASRFVEVLLYIPIILSQTITPLLVQSLERSYDEYRIKSQQFMNISVWFSLFASAIVSMIAYWLVKLTFGQAYIPAVVILQIMSFKAASVALSSTAGAMLITEGLQKYAIIRDSFGCLVCVVLNYIFLPKYGVIAAAFVAILSNLSAGFIADAFIPAYRHLFRMQVKTIVLGWRDLLSFKKILFDKGYVE